MPTFDIVSTVDTMEIKNAVNQADKEVAHRYDFKGSDAQLEIMNVVWDRGEVTVSDVWHCLAEKREVARNTVQTVMTRMAAKGLLTLMAAAPRRTWATASATDQSATRSSMARDLSGSSRSAMSPSSMPSMFRK